MESTSDETMSLSALGGTKQAIQKPPPSLQPGYGHIPASTPFAIYECHSRAYSRLSYIKHSSAQPTSLQRRFTYMQSPLNSSAGCGDSDVLVYDVRRNYVEMSTTKFGGGR